VIPLLLLGALLQGERPLLEASVDEDRLSVGEELVYTLRAVSHSPVPMQISIAPFLGLEIVGRSERTEISTGARSSRTTVLEIRLRAGKPGRWQLGPAKAIQGRDTVEAAALVIDVTAGRAATATGLSPRLHRLLDRAQPPVLGQPVVHLLISPKSVRVGEQVDVVTAAWFPRELRLQLRRPPTLQPPVIDGVWSYPQTTPTGIAATRNIRGHWYDLFLAHQVVFPLVPGTITIPRATLKYSTPVAMQFFSQEERFALTSDPETLSVQPLPQAGRPVAFNGAVGSGLTLERRLGAPTAQVGEAIPVEFLLRGEGNTALWPAPEVRWPSVGRAYMERVDERVTGTEGRVGGTKTFRFLVVADSAGLLALPAVHYPYFDLGAGRYLTLEVPPGSVPVAPAGEAATASALPPSLLPAERAALAWRLGHRVPGWAWVAILLLPPLVLGLRGAWAPRARPRRPVAARDDLRSAEEELDALVRVLIPDPDRRFGPGFASAMRAAGADAELASQVASARERLLARRYGPGPGLSGESALALEVHQLVQRLGGSVRGRQVRGVSVGLMALLILGSSGAAQSPTPEALYEKGSLRAAAEGFAQRVAEEPASAANWYNLGAAYYRQGLAGQAEAAWLQARRLAPREAVIRRALQLTPPTDGISARWNWSPPVTPEELLLLGSLGWLAGWIGWALRPRTRDRWLVILVFAGGAVLGGLGLRAWYRRPLGIVTEATSLMLSPHGRAPTVSPVEGGTTVRILIRSPGWALVRAPGGREGWLSQNAFAVLGS
jgi:tetratricopeptide (TPR) repeat protein